MVILSMHTVDTAVFLMETREFALVEDMIRATLLSALTASTEAAVTALAVAGIQTTPRVPGGLTEPAVNANQP